MRNFVSKLLLFTFLFHAIIPACIKDELAKAPELYAHYQEHLVLNPDLHLIQFLHLHYGDEFATHQSEHNHSQLPGKQHNHQFHYSFETIATISLDKPYLHRLTDAAYAPIPAVKAQMLHTQYSNCIWQPPRA